MIELTQIFKQNLFVGGAHKYFIEISEDNGISWQTLPSGAEAVLPLGQLNTETEIEPFDFTGSDIEISAANDNGYWTNSGKTGKLDTGAAVRLRIKIEPANVSENVKLIDGFIDLASVVNYRTESRVSFIVRGLLNVLDSVLANYVLADRPGRYPYRFGWIEVVSVDAAHPEGLFELRSDDNRLSWDNGEYYDIDTSDNVVLRGRTGTITIKNTYYAQTATGRSSENKSQFLAIKTVNGVKGIYQPPVSMPISRLKTMLYSSVDLNYEKVDSFAVYPPDANIISYIPQTLFGSTDFTELNPAHVVCLNDNRWIVSFDGGALTGNYIIETAVDPYLRVVSFTSFDPTNITANMIIVNAYKTNDYIYLLIENSATRKNQTYNSTTNWGIAKYTSGLVFVGYYAGSGDIFFKSFAGKQDNLFYACMRHNTNGFKIYSVQISGGAIVSTAKTQPPTVGISMLPGMMIYNGRYYVTATGYIDTTDNKTKVYLIFYDTVEYTTNYFYRITEIENDYNLFNKSNIGPIGIGYANTKNESGYAGTLHFGVYVLVSEMLYAPAATSPIAKPITSEKRKLYLVKISTIAWAGPVAVYSSDKTKVIVAAALAGSEGFFLTMLTGDNVGETRVITAAAYNSTTKQTTLTLQTALPGYNVVGDLLVIDTRAGDIRQAGNITTEPMDVKNVGCIKSNNTYGVIATTEACHRSSDKLETLYKTPDCGYPYVIDYSTNGNYILTAGKNNLFISYIPSEGSVIDQYPEVVLADYDAKTLRQALGELAISCNAYAMPSDHNNKISLIYRGLPVNPTFNLANTEYIAGPRWVPYCSYDLVDVNDSKVGVIYAGNKQRSLTVDTQTTPGSYSQSLAKDILDNLGSGERLHELTVIGRMELEPGDDGYLELQDGTTVKIRILSIITDTESLTRQMIFREM